MSRRTQFLGSAAGRRRERRAHLQPETNEVLVNRRTTPSKVELACKRKPAMRAELVTITYMKQELPSGDNCCLPSVSLYRARYQSVREEATHIVK